ncbi:uncharacterized protein LOC133529896 [Cydia pomonella]|uniref:uncharacterized protein LOC133529896 n=1 Tax=Cydia pomonella TaxID=82600 RepID=UPI002ADD844D|nr:uncharacterized protein LOC133529896 [Cydia pomonella]
MDRIRNTTLRSKIRIADVGTKTVRLKWDWAGHVCRMHSDRGASIATKWMPQVKRGRGRPRLRWRDDLDTFFSNWPEIAQQRELWRYHEERPSISEKKLNILYKDAPP